MNAAAMNSIVFAVGFVLLSWWFSTGLILVLNGLPRSTFPYSLGATSALALSGLAALVLGSRSTTPAAAYVGFCGALAMWAWHELTFLLGIITGPRKTPCPPDAQGWKRFRYATEVVIHHQLALAGSVVLVVLLTWHQPNQVGAQTLLVLWVMRLSAELNVFLGVRNLTEEFVPMRLRYMLSYFRRRRLNALMPLSVFAGSAAVIWLARQAAVAPAFMAIAQTLVAAILALAVIEHIFLALPVPDAVLWRWAVRLRRGRLPVAPTSAP